MSQRTTISDDWIFIEESQNSLMNSKNVHDMPNTITHSDQVQLSTDITHVEIITGLSGDWEEEKKMLLDEVERLKKEISEYEQVIQDTFLEYAAMKSQYIDYEGKIVEYRQEISLHQRKIDQLQSQLGEYSKRNYDFYGNDSNPGKKKIQKNGKSLPQTKKKRTQQINLDRVPHQQFRKMNHRSTFDNNRKC